MYSRKQIKAIIDVLKDHALDGRPALQRVFEQGGYLWATNGYVVLELGEVKDELRGKCIKLESLVGWYGTHKAKDTATLTDMLEDNDQSAPDIKQLLHKEYKEAHNPKFDVRLVRLGTAFLEVDNIALEETPNNHSKCYRIKPLEELSVSSRATGIKAYVMGLSK